MLVTILMSTYNERLVWIKEAIESIINQTYKNLEILIIIDNPKNKEITELLEYYKSIDNRIKLIKNQKNLGLVASLNKGIELANGEYIARMDADDICTLDRIEKQVDYILKRNIDILGGGRDIISENSKIVRPFSSQITGEQKVKKILEYKDIVFHPTWLVKKEVYYNLNKYRNIKAAEDYDFLFRALLNGYKIDNINMKVLQYRTRNNSISNSNNLQQVLTSFYLQKEYKKNKIISIDELEVKLSEHVNERNTSKFQSGMRFLNLSIKNKRNKEWFLMVINLIKSMCSSRFVNIYVYMRLKYIFKLKFISNTGIA